VESEAVQFEKPLEYTEKWAAQQFGEKHAKEIARMINLYSKYNRRVTPETLTAKHTVWKIIMNSKPF
jgi:hypothetical protein